MNMNRYFLILCLLLSFAGGDSVIQAAESWSYPPGKPETPFGGGTGTQSDPYRISTAQHLANLAYMVTDNNTEYHGKYFVLTNDITLNDDVINEAGTGLKKDESSYRLWTPIGEYGTTADDDFRGFFDGQGHTISGLVCISEDGKRNYLALFGTTDDATIKNLNMKDSYVCTKAIDSKSQSYGMLIGKSMNTTVINCHVANSVVNVTHNNSDVRNFVGGLVGCCDYYTYAGFFPASSHKTIMTNCSFSGKIYTTLDGDNNTLYVGGLFGYQMDDDNSVELTNCNTEGDIYIKVLKNVDDIYGGGIAARISYCNDSDLKRCVSRMNITVESGNNTIEECYLSGFYAVDNWTGISPQRVSQCASLGTITVGTAANKAKINNLYLGGFSYWYGFLSSCAFYGKFDVHSEGKEIRITPLAKSLCKFDNTPSVVCSVGNVIDINYSKTINLDQVSTYTYRYDAEGNNHYCVDQHNYYYRFENTSGVTVPCNGTLHAPTFNKTVSEMKTDDFIKTLNNDADSNVWGKLTGESEELNGLPMPIACGGDVTGLAGQGTDTDPFLITCEAELRALQKGIAVGNRPTDGLYFKLTNDIYMSNEPMPAIGSTDYPFKGTFDGGGHAIVGMVAKKGTLFDALAGTLQNLALVDFKVPEGQTIIAPLAGYVGGKYTEQGESVTHTGTVKNCYVTGDIKMVAKDDGYYPAQATLTGLCLAVYENSTMENCYFKGSFNATYPNPSSTSTGGIFESKPKITFGGCFSSVHGTVKNCYASYSLSVDNNFTEQIIKGVGYTGSGTVTDCYYVRTDLTNTTSGECLATEKELNDKFSGKSGWSQGLYRPVLTGVKSYKATFPDNSETKYLDAVPDPTPKSNYIMNVTAGNDPYADKLVWQLPNVAVYVPSEQTDYILNCTLDQTASFKYNRTEGATKTAGQLCYTLKQNASGYHMLCLPGVVERGDLPKDSKVMIYGKIRTVGTSQEINAVHVDTIPAGVPCILYVPTSAYAEGSDIPLVMRSEIRTEPLVDANYSDMKGTFHFLTYANGPCVTAFKSEDGNVYFKKSEATHCMEPFTAWLEGAAGDVKIVDYILLDEGNEAMTVTLAGLNGQMRNLKMRRTIKASKWNTVCLPFDMTAEEIAAAFGEGTKVEEFSSLTYDSSKESTTLQFSNAETITAGTPYLLKPGKTTDASIFDIKSKEIKCASETFVPTGTTHNANTTTTTLTMQGEYNHRTITPDEATNGKTIYVISGDKIYHVNSDVEMKGFRCYFVAEDTQASSANIFSNAKVMHSDGTSTDLRLIDAEATGDTGAVYDLLGRKRDEQTKGIVIENGKKRIIK